MRDSFRQLKEYLDKTEAQMKYPEAARENSRLKTEVTTLQYQLKKAEDELSKYKNLKTRFAGKEIDLKEFNMEMLEQTQKVYGEEIERKTQEKFKVKAPSLTKKELNRLLKLPRKKRTQELNTLLDNEISDGVNLILRTEDSWPSWFKQSIKSIIKERVENRLDNIYWSNVRDGIRKAKEEEWPKHLEKYIREKITPVCNTILINSFVPQLINQRIILICKKCKTRWNISLIKEDISNLLEKGVTVFACANPNCIEGIINKHPTHIRYYLGEAVSKLIGEPSMPQNSITTHKIVTRYEVRKKSLTPKYSSLARG